MQEVIRAAPIPAAVSLSAGYGSLITVALGFPQMLANTASVQAMPVQNWMAEQACPQAPQFRGSLWVSTQPPLQQVDDGSAQVPASVQGRAASSNTSRTSRGGPSGAASAAGLTGASTAASTVASAPSGPPSRGVATSVPQPRFTAKATTPASDHRSQIATRASVIHPP